MIFFHFEVPSSDQHSFNRINNRRLVSPRKGKKRKLESPGGSVAKASKKMK